MTIADVNTDATYTAERVLIGHCPTCGAVLVVFNNHRTWPLVECACGWKGDTLSLANRRRIEAGWMVDVAGFPQQMRPE